METLYGLRAFLDGLNNTQVRSIANMRIDIGGELNKRIVPRLSGLEHLHVEISTEHKANGARSRLECHARKDWIHEIGGLDLNSLRVSCDMAYYGMDEPTEAEVKSIEEWLELAEVEWLKPSE